MSSYRLDYASTSPRTECSNCRQLIRSGDIRFTAYQTFRHLDCVTYLELVNLLRHCKSFDSIPGFSSLEYEDREQVRTLFQTLLVSTPAPAHGVMMRARLAAAASGTSSIRNNHSMVISTSGHPRDVQMLSSSPIFMSSNSPYDQTLQREPSDTMMIESSTSPPSIDPFNVQMGNSPDVVPLPASLMPPGQPVLSATPSALAYHLSNLSCCSTPNNHNGTSPTPFLQYSNPGSGGHHVNCQHHPSQQQNAHSPSMSLAHRPLFRDISNHSNTSSPSLLPHHLTQQSERSISPLDSPWNTNGHSVTSHLGPSSVFHQHPPPPSPHSNHTSPIPFSSHIPSSRPFHTNGTTTTTAASQPQPIRSTKRKIAESIPEEDSNSNYSSSPTSSNFLPIDPDAMMDAPIEMEEDLSHSSKKRRTIIKPVR